VVAGFELQTLCLLGRQAGPLSLEPNLHPFSPLIIFQGRVAFLPGTGLFPHDLTSSVAGIMNMNHHGPTYLLR
jgi:hypothetical protein